MTERANKYYMQQVAGRTIRNKENPNILERGMPCGLTDLQEELTRGIERLAQEFENNKDVPQWVYDLIKKARSVK